MSDEQGRRSDDLEPAVELAIDKAQAATRHWMRDELAAIGAKVDLFAAQSTKEHSQVAAKLDRLSSDVAELKPLAAKVAALELADAQAEAVAAARREAQSDAERAREQSRSQFRWLVALIVAAVPSIAVLVQLFSH